MTNTDLASESGLSLATNWTLYPPSPPPADLAKLRSDSDPHWRLLTSLPFANFRKATNNVDIFLPRIKPPKVALLDEIIRLKNGERFHLESLGLVNDVSTRVFSPILCANPSPLLLVFSPFRCSNAAKIFPQLVDTFGAEHEGAPFGKNWYPTLVLNLDVKRALPPEGAEFLSVRVQAMGIRNGRMDLEVVIRDENAELVAVGHHVSLILSASRNLAERSGARRTAAAAKGGAPNGSKI